MNKSPPYHAPDYELRESVFQKKTSSVSAETSTELSSLH
jgi:hypothetical protein